MTPLDPVQQQSFARSVVEKLRAAGYEAYWAGGCVRDFLLGKTPKDYDVATNALPEQVQTVFTPQKTLPIGVAFGVIQVRGPRAAGAVEVATFRQDGEYLDGRRPEGVRFCTAVEDARRRDFTINGMFFDPVREEVLDFVGGQEDLAAKRIRAIGDPHARFDEDKLRMLRAVRFAALLDFELEEATFAAVVWRAEEIIRVSCERIREELRRMLQHARRTAALELLGESRLLHYVFPEAVPLWDRREEPDLAADSPFPSAWRRTLAWLAPLAAPSFSLVLATAMLPRLRFPADDRRTVAELVEGATPRLRLSNDESKRLEWLLESAGKLDGAPQKPWSQIQPLLVHPGAEELLALETAIRVADGRETPDREDSDLRYCRARRAWPKERLDPPPLVHGGDLLTLQLPRGPFYKILLDEVRAGQLDATIASRDEALAYCLRRHAELASK